MKENSYALDEISIRLERFIKKYKIILIAIISLVVLIGIALYVSDKIKENNIKEANFLFLQLEKKYDENQLKKLQNLNSNLYLSLIMNDDKYLKQLQDFKADDEDALLLQIYKSKTLQSDIFLKDIQHLNKAYKLLQENKIKEAREILNLIPLNSIFYQDAQRLKHYQGQ